ncbi:hypothetical protein, partial [Serratia marcescens]|uniref:hypothetical protein n=1 Tax=Serratia marcescens TaxID=615 RepID=UPI00344B2C6D
ARASSALPASSRSFCTFKDAFLLQLIKFPITIHSIIANENQLQSCHDGYMTSAVAFTAKLMRRNLP